MAAEPSLRDARDRLCGLWRVTGYENRASADDAWAPTYATAPKGLLAYHASGHLSVHVSAGEELPYVGYVGTYEITEAREVNGITVGVVEHHIDATNLPGLLAADPPRPFALAGNRLILGDQQTWQRFFERIE
jgi:Lipocalin-like domain